MKWQLWPLFLLAVCPALCSTSSADEPGWTPLLTDDLSTHWEAWFGVPPKSVSAPGYPTSTSDNGQTGEPWGLIPFDEDPIGLFSVEQEQGRPVLKISGQMYAGLTSKEVYSDYHLSLQFKWGDKKWAPRLNAKRDSGVLLHCSGPHGAFWNVWMGCLECQVQEGDCGDFFPLAGGKAKVRASPGEQRPQYDVASNTLKSGVVSHAPSEEKPHGEWNTIEVYALGDDLVFLVNGEPVNALLDATYKGKPVRSGKIQIQSEGAEVYYRDIKLRPIERFPEFLSEHVRPL